MGYHKIIGDALFGKVSIDESAMRAAHLYAVQMTLTCKGCGDILDVRRSVYVESTGGAPVACVCGTCWDKVVLKPEILAQLKVHDGRRVK